MVPLNDEGLCYLDVFQHWDLPVYVITRHYLGSINHTLLTLNAFLPRQSVVEKALENSRAIVFDTIQQGIAFSNFYAPEHLILATEDAENMLRFIENAGSVFLGNYSCESAGDYASGTNHTLPANGFAKNYSGIS